MSMIVFMYCWHIPLPFWNRLGFPPATREKKAVCPLSQRWHELLVYLEDHPTDHNWFLSLGLWPTEINVGEANPERRLPGSPGYTRMIRADDPPSSHGLGSHHFRQRHHGIGGFHWGLDAPHRMENQPMVMMFFFPHMIGIHDGKKSHLFRLT